jgi:hypothetical protein
MSDSKMQQTAPWLDRFNEPSIATLRKGLEEDAAAIFDDARKMLLSLADCMEEQRLWMGDCWHWTICYRLHGFELPVALLIPNPEDLQIAMPLKRSFIESLPQKRLKRSIRDGLELAAAPFHTNWAIWSTPFGGTLVDLKPVLSAWSKSLDAGDE